MSIQIALIRAVNVGGTGKVPMADLRKAAQDAGFGNVRTLLQSGNMVFEAARKSPAASEKALEALLAKEFGFKTDIFVRTPDELAAAIAQNPFPKEAKDDPARLHVFFMRVAPPAAGLKSLKAAIVGRERLGGDGKHLYIHYPDGAGESKLTAALIARHLGTPGTARNWNTVQKLLALTA